MCLLVNSFLPSWELCPFSILPQDTRTPSGEEGRLGHRHARARLRGPGGDKHRLTARDGFCGATAASHRKAKAPQNDLHNFFSAAPGKMLQADASPSSKAQNVAEH